jgi:hypothetical protein
MSEDEALVLGRAAFAGKLRIDVGVKPQRLQMFVADLVVEMLHRGLLALLARCRAFRQLTSRDTQHFVILAYTHESDGTAQGIAQHLIQRIGRATSRRLSAEVLNQQGYLHITLGITTDGQTETATMEHRWVAPSVAMLGKSAFCPEGFEVSIRGGEERALCARIMRDKERGQYSGDSRGFRAE